MESLKVPGPPISFAAAYAVIAWLSWVPNLAIAVLVTRRTRSSALIPVPR